MIFKFLWKGPDKVMRNSVINSVENGGLSLMEFETQIKAWRLFWILHILDSSKKGPWKSYFNIIWNVMEEPFYWNAIMNSRIWLLY